MKRFLKSTMLATAGLGLGCVAAQAQINPNDIVIDFSLSTATSDYIVDVGQLLNGNSGVQNLSGDFSISTFNSIFTGGFNGVSVGAIGANNTGSTGSDIFGAQLRTGSNPAQTPGTETPYTKPSAGSISSAGSIPPGMTTGNVTKSGSFVSWSYNVAQDFQTAGANSSHNWVTVLGNENPMSQLGSSGLISLDLFEAIRTGSLTSSPWAYQGTLNFDFSNPSTMTVTFQAVPEPSTYGLIAGAGLLLVAFRRRLNAAKA